MHGVILDGDSLAPADLDLSPITDTLNNWKVYPSTPAAQTAARIGSADVVVSNKVLIDETVMAQCPNLRLICVIATGTNNIDLSAASRRGITVCNATGYGTASVVQHTFALLLALTNNIKRYDRDSRNGRWAQSPFFCLLDYPVVQLAGKTLGIVGYGELGKGVASLAQAFGMKVLVSQRPGDPSPCPTSRVPLPELLAQVDVLSLHCPLTEATANLIGEGELAAMKAGALLINCARGGIVDEQALAHSLRSGHLGGAACDVLSQEPPVEGNPLLAEDLPNLIITPHMAWGSREARQTLVNIVGDNIQGYVEGKPHNTVN